MSKLNIFPLQTLAISGVLLFLAVPFLLLDLQLILLHLFLIRRNWTTFQYILHLIEDNNGEVPRNDCMRFVDWVAFRPGKSKRKNDEKKAPHKQQQETPATSSATKSNSNIDLRLSEGFEAPNKPEPKGPTVDHQGVTIGRPAEAKSGSLYPPPAVARFEQEVQGGKPELPGVVRGGGEVV